MALTVDSKLEISLRMLVQGQVMLNVFDYQVFVLSPGTTAVGIAQAWWNDVKAVYRGLAYTSYVTPFQSVRIRQLDDPAGVYAEYSIPAAEQGGTRTISGSDDFMPPFAACGVRFTVGSRVTRPGQKRLPFVTEVDQNAGVLQTAFLALVETWAAHMQAPMVLGAPAALTEIHYEIMRVDASGVPIAAQEVLGHVINANVTTQNTRKIGRGI